MFSWVGFISKHFNFNCTVNPDDLTIRPLEPFISRGDFKASNERVQTDKRQINKHYCRPAKQYESDSSMTNAVHDTNLILLVFLN